MSYHLSSQDLFNKGFFLFFQLFYIFTGWVLFLPFVSRTRSGHFGPKSIKGSTFSVNVGREGTAEVSKGFTAAQRDKEQHGDDGLETEGGHRGGGAEDRERITDLS